MANPESTQKSGFKHLHSRYIGGLAILGFLSVFALFLGQRTAASGSEFGHLINQSGLQRGLSQRTALLARELAISTTEAEFNTTHAALQQARDVFLTNHSDLIAFENRARVGYQLSDTARSAFHTEPHNVDNKVREYVRSLDSYLALKFRPDLQRVLDKSSPQYLPLYPDPVTMFEALDATVQIFEDESHILLSQIKLQGQWVFGVEVFMLVSLGILFFRPLVHQFKDEHERLQEMNQHLSLVVEEREKSDEARAEVETRFRRAFENAPIGMGLLDAESHLYEANPALIEMLWPGQKAQPQASFCDLIDPEDQVRFESRFAQLATFEIERVSETFNCVNAAGEKLIALVNLSAVRSRTGEFMYSVLQTRDVTEAHHLTNKLEYQANYDELTKLLNRRSFESELGKAWKMSRDGGPSSFLLFMDLDQFKIVNDTSGHAAGDELLCAIAEILRNNVRGDDAVCRLGGDEFAIILWDCPLENASHVAETIRASIESYRFEWSSESYRVGVSIGGVPIDSEMGTPNGLRQLADSACYAAKEAGRNQVYMISEDEDAAKVHRRQVRWLQRLRDALDNNRFAIHCQTMIPLNENTQERERERVEVLIRLRDPVNRKLIPPGAFLPAAERYGLIMEIDEWVVTQLLNSLYVFHQFNSQNRDYWINLSGASIGDKRFAPLLKSAVERSPLPPGTINFEISETSIVRNISAAASLMTELHEMGCRFALDDFGSGLSSFGYLKDLPIDYLKIDSTFTRDILNDKTDQICVRAIIDIAHTLNIKTVAEYVENEETLKLVKQLGADYAQGYGVARPTVLTPNFSAEALSSSNQPPVMDTA